MQPPPVIKVLLIEDDEDDFIIARDLLAECESHRFDLVWKSTYETGLQALRQGGHDVCLVDYQLNERYGLDLLQEAVGSGCSGPIIMLTGQGDHAIDVEAMKAGAADFLVKGQLTASLLERTIRYALERFHAMAALRHSEERYRVLFESNPQPMWVYDRESLAILTANCAAINHYGYSRDEFLTMTIQDLHLPEHDSAVEEAGNPQANAMRRPGICKQRKKNGELIDVESSTHDLMFDGRAARLVMANDVTERLNLEMELRQAQKIESVGQLAAGVAHDFNNILTVIQGQSCLLLARADLQPNMTEALTQIRVSAERAANLTRQLLTFSRRQIMQFKLVDFNEVINNVTKMLNRLLGENIELEIKLAAHLPLIHADMGMIEQIIVNLSVNGRDAMPNGGRLTITTAPIEVDDNYVRHNPEARAGCFVRLCVTDRGCGMNSNTLSRIFEPFFTTKEVGKGTGLGLSTVYGITKQHQGWVEVISQVGSGSTFRVFLPATAETSAGRVDQTESPGLCGGTERVLVAEDEPALRGLVRHILEHYGYRVSTACSGVEALKIWQEQNGQFALLLTDIVMPNGLSGLELGARLRAGNPALKVIYTSGYSVDLTEKQREFSGGSMFLQKPFHPDKLARAVRRCLDNGKSHIGLMPHQ